MKLGSAFQIMLMNLSDMSVWGDTESFPNIVCAERKCDKCGVHLVTNHYQDLVTHFGDRMINYEQWEKVEKKSEKKSEKTSF